MDKKPAPRATKAEVDARVEACYKIILDGGDLEELREHAAKEGWPISPETLKVYQRKAGKLFIKRAECDREKLVARAYMQRQALYMRCIRAGDFSTALRVMKDRDELLGLYPPKKFAHTNPQGDKSYDPYSGVGEVAALIAELRTKLERRGIRVSGEAGGEFIIPAHGALAVRPGDDHGHGDAGQAGRPLAAEDFAVVGEEDVIPLFETGWQVNGSGGPGDQSGPA